MKRIGLCGMMLAFVLALAGLSVAENLLPDPSFESVMGEMLFGQMLKAMRKTVGKPAYFHGGRAEEVFTQQLDKVLAEKISHASADKFVGPMYELWTVQGRR